MHADRERWRRITEVFHAALERPPDDREAYIVTASGGDATLAADVRALLASHARASDARFIESPAFENDPELLGGAPSGESLAGRTMGPYRIRREVGRGGMGVVYLAEDTRLGRIVALKALPSRLAADADRRERLRREARAAAALAHPAVAIVYALEEIDGVMFIVSEYIEGHSLRDEIKRGPLPAAEVMATARVLTSALAAAHAQGIVHRDLKPENVMRARDGAIKILDFGLARLLQLDPGAPTDARLTIEGMIVGTPGYMAPEQLEGRPVDARADVYAFGVLLHELATGRLPSSASGRGAAASSPADHAALSSHLAAVIRKCLAPNPADRFQSGVEILAALDAPSSAAPTPPAASALWWWQFHQLAIAALHASLLAGVWAVRGWLDRPWRSVALYTAIVAVTSDVTLRLNLWFASRVHPEMLGAQRTRLIRAIAGIDAIFASLLCALAGVGAGVHDELAALLVGGAIVSLLSLVLIEPATSRAAFGERPRGAPRGRGSPPPGGRRARPTPRRRGRRPLSR